jgi:hypothetical protein
MQGVATGWGVTAQNGPPSDVLNEVTVPILSNKECRTTSYGNKKITDNMICAGFPEGKKDSCQVSIHFWKFTIRISCSRFEKLKGII